MANGEIKEKLVKLLTTVFQFDAADLDFGIYKILNYKKKEISEFINRDLIDEIGKQLSLLSAEEQKKQQQDLENVKKQLIGLGIEDFESNPKYQEKKKQLENIKVSQELEKEIYNHVYTFFSRYYDKGDFLSKRRYGSNEKYSVPYNGEEVLLHWANNDQYYVKTTESFRNFSFRIPGLKVNFKVKEAEEENGNVKSEEDKYFLVSSDKIYDLRGDEIEIYFEFRALNEKEKSQYPKPNQDQINLDIVESIKKALAKESKAEGLFKEENGDKMPLTKYLNKYTKRNTSDYFIHKDLKGFLERDLDFYIKNEVVDLSDVTQLDIEHFNRYIIEVKVLRNICIKIIEFLDQIENFQKKLWEKKKFVLNTDYCITLDYIDEKYYPEILKNKEQLEEWKKIYSFDVKDEIKKLKGTLKGHKGGNDEIEILKHNPTLMIDTKFFDENFKINLLETVEISDEKINGILINSENFQALNLLLEKYRNKIKCCYIDPPFNTGPSEILYKNNYKDSSWLSLMENRLKLSRDFLRDDSVYFIAIDDYELAHLCELVDNIFSNFDRNVIVVNHHPQGGGGSNVSRTHEYSLVLTPFGKNILKGSVEEDRIEERPLMRSGTAENNFRYGRRNSFYAILVDPSTNEVKGAEAPPVGNEYPKEKTREGLLRIYPLGGNNVERVWRLSYESALKSIKNGLIKCSKNKALYQIIQHENRRSVIFSNWVDKRYNAGTHGTNLISDIIGKSGVFSYPKSLFTVRDSIEAATHDLKDSIIVDYFAGSGTTGHATISLNNEDDGNRKFILVEMGQYFDTVLKPRIQKIIFRENWKEGKPQDGDGTPKQIIKYHSLEQYEDALENIEFSQKKLSEFSDYFVKYVLDFETRDSKAFLNIDKVKDPFNYKINIMEDYQQKEVTIDLIETYNYLIGMDIEKFKTFENKDDRNRKYVTIQGKRDDKPIIVIWRNTEGLDAGKDRDFIQKNILKDQYDEIHVNGDSLIKNAILIEEQFKTLMNGS